MLIGGLAQAGFATLLPWGSAVERERSERLAHGSSVLDVPAAADACRARRVCSRNADLVVGVDTGLTHLAAALGTPTIALFTETDPARRRRRACRRARARSRRRGHVPTLDEVQAAAGELLRAAPQLLNGERALYTLLWWLALAVAAAAAVVARAARAGIPRGDRRAIRALCRRCAGTAQRRALGARGVARRNTRCRAADRAHRTRASRHATSC